MKFSFFKGQVPDTKQTSPVFIPPRVGNRPAPAPPPPTVKLAGAETSIPLRLSSILQQLPRSLFGGLDKSQLAGITLAVPSERVLPQLSTGKVAITLAELAPSLPADLVDASVLEGAEAHTILLPLAEMIAAIPAESFALPHDAVISLDSPELAKLPGLFEEEIEQDAEVAATATRIPSTPTPAMAPVTTGATTGQLPRLSDTQPLSFAANKPPVAPPSPTRIPLDVDLPEYVKVTLRSLVNGMPDRLFICPKTDLGQRVDLEAIVPLPVEPMLPQLQTARVSLPLAMIISLVPSAILVNPLPALGEGMVTIPLFEIVPQLPARLFTAQLSSTQPHEFAAVETEIPTPFQERAPRVTAQPAPVTALPTEVDEELTEISADELEKQEVAIFAEKTTPPTVAVPQIEPLTVAEEVPPVPASVPVSEESPVAPVAAAPAHEIVEFTALPEPAATAPELPTGMPRVIDEKKFLIDLNRCCVEDLLHIEGVGRTLAQRIIDFRSNRGQFTSVDELRLIPGVGAKTFRALTGVEPRSLNRLLGVEDDREMTLQEIVRLTSALAGIEGCMLAMADGLFLTGQLPPHLDQEAISVFAPQLFKKVGRYVKELKIGQVRRFTLFTDQRPLSVFRAGDVYLIVIHDTRHFSKRLLRQCERISQEIARLCRQRTIV